MWTGGNAGRRGGAGIRISFFTLFHCALVTAKDALIIMLFLRLFLSVKMLPLQCVNNDEKNYHKKG